MAVSISRRGFLSHVAIPVLALAVTACIAQAQNPPPEQSTLTPAAEASPPAAAPTAAAVGTATPAAAKPGPSASVTPGAGSVVVEVTPSEVAIANVTLSMALEPARYMFDQASMVGSVSSDPAQQQSKDAANAQTKGSAVFPGGMLRATNNFDPSQGAPTDSPQAIVRHVVVRVKTKDHGQVVPYLNMSMDVLLDGRPVLLDQGLAPMVAVDQDSAQLYYGNNVKFPQRGTYQVFVRMQSSPLLGRDQPQAAQFNLTLR